MVQIERRKAAAFQAKFVQDGGKDASKCAAKAQAVDCAALTQLSRGCKIWQYRRERFLVQEEIKDVPAYGSLKLRIFHAAKTAVSLSSHTEFARLAVITRTRLL